MYWFLDIAVLWYILTLLTRFTPAVIPAVISAAISLIATLTWPHSYAEDTITTMSQSTFAPRAVDTDEDFSRTRKPAADELMPDDCSDDLSESSDISYDYTDGAEEYHDAAEYLVPTSCEKTPRASTTTP